ncbi:4a-hydroxytetrahydrobiopterin dehydratase [Aeromicrobium terrae]|uniref:Putative pterin-4-alpha-carbinolamine dehydratase n=1 Tax=Aeromicrobium terrae TaxID=2498846 RepID=A0A5C8NLW5_9ACTN|nr:4a-hydroxytetrahydrobiopterin dehydratase [Aeromicrobium terrae]TXL62057.1 4a-hydroxytetrahydrobiopterin dehydratase [Aeromicrobium terrae]
MTDVPEGWTEDGDAITKRFEFADFAAAIAFMNRAAGPIDEMNHHPEWTNVYNRVDVRLTSHDTGAVTDRDLRLAGVLDELAQQS